MFFRRGAALARISCTISSSRRRSAARTSSPASPMTFRCGVQIAVFRMAPEPVSEQKHLSNLGALYSEHVEVTFVSAALKTDAQPMGLANAEDISTRSKSGRTSSRPTNRALREPCQ